MRPFRFGILTKGAPTAKAWHDLLGRVQDAGFSSLLIPVHSTPQFSPAAALADAAARTQLRIGTLVANNDLQHPALLARDAATLALLSDGRFELGIGVGWMERDYQQLGLPLDPGPERVARLAESIEILRRLWGGHEVSYDGDHYQVAGCTGTAVPPVPLLVGAGGRRMLALAAATADIVSLSRDMSAGSTSPEIALDAALESVERKAGLVRALAGEPGPELNILCVRTAVGPDARVHLDKYVATTGVSLQTARETPEHLLAASPQELSDLLQERRARTGINYYVIRDADLHQARVIVERLSGVS
jgi:probable F420-dependent oxidoreductase